MDLASKNRRRPHHHSHLSNHLSPATLSILSQKRTTAAPCRWQTAKRTIHFMCIPLHLTMTTTTTGTDLPNVNCRIRINVWTHKTPPIVQVNSPLHLSRHQHHFHHTYHPLQLPTWRILTRMRKLPSCRILQVMQTGQVLVRFYSNKLWVCLV